MLGVGAGPDEPGGAAYTFAGICAMKAESTKLIARRTETNRRGLKDELK
jgi:hypothetical protein